MDFIAELALELLSAIGEVYLDIARFLVPEHKFKKWQEISLKVLSVLVSLAVIALMAIGIAFLVINGKSVVGTILLSVGAAVLAVQFVLMIIVAVCESKKKAKEKKLNDTQLSDLDEEE